MMITWIVSWFVLGAANSSPAVELDAGHGQVCSAALIAPRLAVTAAHCATLPNVVVRQGKRSVGVVAIATHPAWLQSHAHDIAVVTLAEALDGSLSLPAAPRHLELDDELAFAGFGGSHRGLTRPLRATTGTRQWYETTSPAGAVVIGDSGAPVVRLARPTELVGIVDAALPRGEGAIVTTFDASDLAFIHSASK